MASECHYRGDKVAALHEMAATGHLFGPDICGPQMLGEVLGRGAVYELVEAEYSSASDITTARFAPHINPTRRIRYYGDRRGWKPRPIYSDSEPLANQDDIEAQ